MISCKTCMWFKSDDTTKVSVHKPSGWCMYRPPNLSTADGRPRTYAEDRCSAYETSEEWEKWHKEFMKEKSSEGQLETVEEFKEKTS